MATIVSGTGIVFPDLTTQATAGITPGASLAFTGANTFAGTSGFNGAVTLSSGLKDSAGNLGTAGQLLSTTGSVTLWVNAPTSSGNNTYTGTSTFTNTVTLSAGVKDSSGSFGTAGQILSTTGTATLWVNSGTLLLKVPIWYMQVLHLVQQLFLLSEGSFLLI